MWVGVGMAVRGTPRVGGGGAGCVLHAVAAAVRRGGCLARMVCGCHVVFGCLICVADAVSGWSWRCAGFQRVGRRDPLMMGCCGIVGPTLWVWMG